MSLVQVIEHLSEAARGLASKVAALRVDGGTEAPAPNPLLAGDPDVIASWVTKLLPTLGAGTQAARDAVNDEAVREQLRHLVEAVMASLSEYAFGVGCFSGYDRPADTGDDVLLVGYGRMRDPGQEHPLLVMAGLRLLVRPGEQGAVTLALAASYLPGGVLARPGAAWPAGEPQPEPLGAPRLVAELPSLAEELVQGQTVAQLRALLVERALQALRQANTTGPQSHLRAFRQQVVQAMAP